MSPTSTIREGTSTIITTSYLLRKYVNNASKVPCSKIDKTLKAMINTLRSMNYITTPVLIEYLNRVRLVYFIKRLKYYSFEDYKKILG